MRYRIPGLIAAAWPLPAFASAAEPKRAPGTKINPASGVAQMSVNVAQLWDAERLAGTGVDSERFVRDSFKGRIRCFGGICESGITGQRSAVAESA